HPHPYGQLASCPQNRPINITRNQHGQLASCPYTQTKKCINLAISLQKRSILLKISIIITINKTVNTTPDHLPKTTKSIYNTNSLQSRQKETKKKNILT